MHSTGTQPYTYMCPFSPKLPSHPGCHVTLSRVPCAAYSRALLVVCFKYTDADRITSFDFTVKVSKFF